MDEKQPQEPLLAEDGKPLTFEAALAELEGLVECMEDGETSLEDSVRFFERGVRLHLHCQRALDAADQKVSILLGEDAAEGDAAGSGLAPFAVASEPDPPR